MNYTLLDVPLLKNLLRFCAVLYLKITGWKREGQVPNLDKFLIIAAPHTSNWDFPISLAMLLAFKVRAYWMGKDSMFRWPYGLLFRLLGGIPIDRSKANNAVEQSIKAIKERKKMVLMLSPEGTRKKVAYWKTGFYHIAHGSGVPIVLGYLDYARKVGGIGGLVYASGNIESDMNAIQLFYSNVTARHPEKSSVASFCK